MRVLKLEDAVFQRPLAAALGYFDGGHLGHAALLTRTVAEAKRHGCESAVFTFTHLPTKNGAPLSTEDDRLAFFERMGIENVILASFGELRTLSPEDFVSSVLVKRCHARLTLCGFNFRFGYKAAGDTALLSRLLPESVVLPPMLYKDSPISSTRIREALSLGNTDEAEAMLGHPYYVSGTVTHGKAVGRALGFPTANIVPKTLLPRYGVYKAEIVIEDRRYMGLCDVGVRPTVENTSDARVEVFLKDFTGDLYGKTLKISFLSFVREEKRFASLEALKEQIARDLQAL